MKRTMARKVGWYVMLAMILTSGAVDWIPQDTTPRQEFLITPFFMVMVPAPFTAGIPGTGSPLGTSSV